MIKSIIRIGFQKGLALPPEKKTTQEYLKKNSIELLKTESMSRKSETGLRRVTYPSSTFIS